MDEKDQEPSHHLEVLRRLEMLLGCLKLLTLWVSLIHDLMEGMLLYAEQPLVAHSLLPLHMNSTQISVLHEYMWMDVDKLM